MNDSELDEILDTWRVPEPPAGLRGKVRAGYREAMAGRRPRWRVGLWAAAAVVCAAAITAAFPQTLKLAPAEKVPFTVDSVMTNYTIDGSVELVADRTSYMRRGVEVTLSESIRDHPLESLAVNFHRFMGELFSDFHEALGLKKPENPRRGEARVAAGCASGLTPRHETILGYDTVEIGLTGNGRRAQTWMAPALGCFPMRQVLEREGPDGAFRTVQERHAVKVTINKVQ